jgi:lipopolysaccharide export LptBFGC system permease protein LptF
MTFAAPTRVLPGCFLLRLAHRFASPAAYDNVFIPLLADYQFEYRRATSRAARLRVRLKWILAFGQTLGLEAVNASAAHLRANAWGTTDEERSFARRLFARVALAATLCGCAVTLDMLRYPVGRQFIDGAGHLALLLPGAFCMALPAGLLLGVALSGREQHRAEPRWRPLLGVASLVGLATFALAAWVTPIANHAFRWRAITHLPVMSANLGAEVARGDREMTLGELSARAAVLRGAGMRAAAEHLDLEWHKKPALGASCLALALLGVAIARRLRGLGWRWPASLLVLLGWFWLLRLGEQAADAGAMAPALAMWGPCFAVTALGLAALARGRACEIGSTPGPK